MAASFSRKLSYGQGFVVFFFVAFAAIVFILVNNIKNKNVVELENNFNKYSHMQQVKLHTVQIQQFLTDVSATRAQDGLDDGYNEAESHFQSLQIEIQAIQKFAKEDNDELLYKEFDEIKNASETFYSVGKRMASEYVKDGPAGGNKIMAEFDSASIALQEKIIPLAEKIEKNLMGIFKLLKKKF